MPRRPRLAAGDLAYHVLNRRVGRLPLFEKPADYTAFEKILAEAHAQTKIRIAAYCLTRIIHKHFCCNRRSPAATSLRAAGSSLGPSTYCTSTPRDLRPPRTALVTRLRDFATNCHE